MSDDTTDDTTALILAAGFGSRIADVTMDPKTLLKVNGKTLMDWHFLAFKAAKISKVVVVTGYKKEMLENYLLKFKNDFDILLVPNDDYKTKGNTYSFFYGLEKISGPFILFDGDLIYESNILKEFVDDQYPNQILVGDTPIDDIECTKTMIDEKGFGRLMVDKRAVSEMELARFKYAGEALGIMKFSKEYRDEIYLECKKFLAESSNALKNWEYVMNLFLNNHQMGIHQTKSHQWVEIDNKEDFMKAKRLFE